MSDERVADTPLVTITCPGCGYAGVSVVPIPVDCVYCSECGHGTPTPPDFHKRDATFAEIVIASEMQARIIAARKGGWT